MRWGVVPVALATALVWSASASAGQLSETKFCTGSPHALTCIPDAHYAAGAGEANDVNFGAVTTGLPNLPLLLHLSGPMIPVTDRGAGMAASLPCLVLLGTGLCPIGLGATTSDTPTPGLTTLLDSIQLWVPYTASAALGDGDDRLSSMVFTYASGGDGNDTLKLSNGGLINGDAGNDTITLANGPTQETAEADGGDGDDTVTAGAGSTSLYGGLGADRLAGGSGVDHIKTGPSNVVSTTFADGAVDVVTCGAGTDTVWAGPEDIVAADCENVVQQ